MEGSDVNTKNYEGSSVFTMAAATKNYDLLDYLLQKGADINSQDSLGRSVLHNWVINNDIKMVKYLLNNGANVNIQNKSGYTPLILSTYYNYDDMARLLIRRGADVNLTLIKGQTSLSYTVYHNNKSLTKLLKSKGAYQGSKAHIHLQTDSNLSSRRSKAQNTTQMEDYQCPKTSVSGLGREDSKSLEYVVSRFFANHKLHQEPRCIKEINATDVINLKGNKIVKYKARVYFPFGYGLVCKDPRRGKGSFSSFNELTGKYRNCDPYRYYFSKDPVSRNNQGYVAPERELIIEGEIEI